MSTSDGDPALPHQVLFLEYVAALRNAIEEAQSERAEAARVAMRAGLGAQDAEASVRRSQGPICTHPRVIAEFRAYFLACDRLNRERPAKETVLPEVFTIEKLMGKHEDLADILAEFPYLPIGADENDHYV